MTVVPKVMVKKKIQSNLFFNAESIRSYGIAMSNISWITNIRAEGHEEITVEDIKDKTGAILQD